MENLLAHRIKLHLDGQQTALADVATIIVKVPLSTPDLQATDRAVDQALSPAPAIGPLRPRASGDRFYSGGDDNCGTIAQLVQQTHLLLPQHPELARHSSP